MPFDPLLAKQLLAESSLLQFPGVCHGARYPKRVRTAE